MGKKKKFDEDKARRRWLRLIKSDTETMTALAGVASFNRRIAQLQEQLYALVHSIDESTLVFNESLKFPKSGNALPIRDYTINAEHWWEYGDNSDQSGPEELAKNLARYAGLSERDGFGA